MWRFQSQLRFFSSSGRKVIKPKSRRPIIQAERARNAEHEARASALGLGWRIVASRYATITATPQPWENEMWELQELIESKQRQWFMEQVGGTEAQMIPDIMPTAEEILESLPFTPAPRITEADIKNDRRSLDRKLEDSLYLIVKRNRDDNAWQFPQGKLLDEEATLRMVSERVLDRAVGKINRWFISNAPIGHICYEYPKEMQEKRKQYGAKVFFYRCQLISGNIKLETRLYTDYAWISRNEVSDYFNAETSAYLSELLPY